MKKVFGMLSLAAVLAACNAGSEDPNLFGGATAFPFECRSLSKRTGAEWDKHCGYVDGVSQASINDLAASGVRIGTGAGSLAELAYGVPTTPGTVRFWGGMLDAASRKIFVGGTWSDNRNAGGDPNLKNFGVLLEVDINFAGGNVGNRRVVSGKYLTKQGDVDVGMGDTLHTVRSVKRFNNQFYVFTMDAGNPGTVVRIDPATGNRSTVWTEKTVAFNTPGAFPADQCENGQVQSNTSGQRRSVQINGLGSPFEMNPNTGEFYLSIIHASNLGSPYGIVKISPDGSTCSWVTRLKATGNNKYADNASTQADPSYGLPKGVGSRGTGFNSMTLNSNNLFYRESAGKKWLYAASGSSYWRMDTETGNRELVVQEAVGDTNTVWDSSRNVAWSSGVGNGTLLGPIFDFDSASPRVGDNVRCLGTANGVPCLKGPGYAGPMNRGGLLFDPLDGNIIFAHNQFGIVRFEVQTGNSYIVSL